MGYQNNKNNNSRRFSNSSRPSGNRSSGSGRSFSGNRSGGGNSRRRSFGGNKNNKKTINPAKFVNKATAFEEVAYAPEHKFADFPFSKQLHANIKKKGYDLPSAIQDQSIPYVIEGRDVIGLANTGTGKTAAFLLPIIDRQQKLNNSPNTLIIAPTRELAQQINDQFRQFSNNMKLYSALVVGGTNIDRQIREVKRRPNIIVGTPGRLKDLMRRRVLRLDTISTLVLDEADRMLDMGFLPDIKQLISELPTERQTLFFSATITPEIEKLTKEFLKDPVTVSVRTGVTSDHVEQGVIEVRDKSHKIETLKNMLVKESYEKVLVFGETKFGVQRLSDDLSDSGISSIAIHGNKSQGQRQRALRQFKESNIRVMVATDVAARGLDIPDVTHVINFDIPQTYEDYIHRIGRTGRAGKSGQAYTFIGAQKNSRR